MNYKERRRFAQLAEAGDYLARYDHTQDDPGSRCGYSDDELAQVEEWLSARGLTLETDDRGLVVRGRG